MFHGFGSPFRVQKMLSTSVHLAKSLQRATPAACKQRMNPGPANLAQQPPTQPIKLKPANVYTLDIPRPQYLT